MRIKKTSETTPTMASVVNTTNSSTTDAYSCDYINEHLSGVVLYNNTSGTTGDITLSDSLSNYSRIDVYCAKGSDSNVCSFWKFDASITITAISQWGTTSYQLLSKRYTITNSTTLTSSYSNYTNVIDGAITQGSENQIKVYKIVGYK